MGFLSVVLTIGDPIVSPDFPNLNKEKLKQIHGKNIQTVMPIGRKKRNIHER